MRPCASGGKDAFSCPRYARAQRILWDTTRIVAEPGAAAPLAASRGERVAVVVSGANATAVSLPRSLPAPSPTNRKAAEQAGAPLGLQPWPSP
jgi:hypothetical protein